MTKFHSAIAVATVALTPTCGALSILPRQQQQRVSPSRAHGRGAEGASSGLFGKRSMVGGGSSRSTGGWMMPSFRSSKFLLSRIQATKDKEEQELFFAAGDEDKDADDDGAGDDEKSWPIKPTPPPEPPKPVETSKEVETPKEAEPPKPKFVEPPKPVITETRVALDPSIVEKLDPLLNPTIAKAVPPETIRGAGIGGALLTLLTSFFLFGPLSVPSPSTLIAAASAAIIAAYVSIIEGAAGDSARVAGSVTIGLTERVVESAKGWQAELEVDRIADALLTPPPSPPRPSGAVTAKSPPAASVEASVDYDAAARLAFEASADPGGDFDEFKAGYYARASAAVKAKFDEAAATDEAAAAEKKRVAAEKKAAAAEAEAVEKKRIAAEEKAAAEAEAAEKKRIAAEEKAAAEAEAAEAKRIAAEKKAAAEAEAAAEQRRLDEEMEELALRTRMRAQEEARAAEAARAKAEEDARWKAEEQAVARARAAAAEEEARAKAEEEASRARAEEEMRLRAEEEAREVAEAEEARRLEEEATRLRAEEEARLRSEEEARKLEEQAAAAREAVRLMEEQEALMDDGDEDGLDDEDWEASVRLANELQGVTSSPIGGDVMDAIGDEMLQMEIDDLSAEEEDALGKAAREAVRKYEQEMSMKSSQIAQEVVTPPPPPVAEETINEVEEVASADVDYSKMTVVQLKDVLRSKGLKLSGKKAVLIERLMESS